MRLFIFVVLAILCCGLVLGDGIPAPPGLPPLPGADSGGSTSTDTTNTIDTDGTNDTGSAGGALPNVDIPVEAMNELLNMYPPAPAQVVIQTNTGTSNNNNNNPYVNQAASPQTVSEQEPAVTSVLPEEIPIVAEPVVSGVPLTSEQRLANLESQVGSVGAVVNDVSQKVSVLPALVSDVASLKNDVSSIRSKLDSAVTAVNEMPGQISAGTPWYVPTLLLVILFVIIGGLLTLVFTRQADKPSSELQSYVAQCFKSGYSKDDVRRALVQGGYSEKDISSVLK